MNLVGQEPIDTHFEDCQKAVSDLQATGDWVDLGSGAGFPGIALAVYNPKATIHLIESRHKRCVFLRRVIAQTQLSNIHVIQQRTENITTQFDGVISRAYKPPKAYLLDAQKLCKPNGKVILLLGEAKTLTELDNWNIQSTLKYSVGTGFRQRLILTPNQ